MRDAIIYPKAKLQLGTTMHKAKHHRTSQDIMLQAEINLLGIFSMTSLFVIAMLVAPSPLSPVNVAVEQRRAWVSSRELLDAFITGKTARDKLKQPALWNGTASPRRQKLRISKP